MSDKKETSFLKGWKEKAEPIKAATYLSSVIFQTVICGILFVLAFIFKFDTETGYFDSGALIPSVAWASMPVFGIWAAGSVFFMKNGSLPGLIPENKKSTFFIAQYLGFISGFDGLYRVKQVFDEAANSLVFFDRSYLGLDYSGYRLYRVCFVVDIATALICLGTAAYFFCIAGKNKKSEAKAVLGFFPVLRAMAGITQIYYEPKIAMNTPMKILIEFAMMSSVLFFLSEIRFLLDERYAKPGWYFSAGLTSMLFNFAAGVSLTVFYFTKSEAFAAHGGSSASLIAEFTAGCGEICLEAFWCLNVFLYIIIRLLCFVRKLSADTKDAAAADGPADNTDKTESAETICIDELNRTECDDAAADSPNTSAAEENGNGQDEN